MDIVSSELSARLHVVGTFTRKEKIVVERIDFILDVIQLLATVLGLHFVPALCDLIVGYMSVYQYQIGIKLLRGINFVMVARVMVAPSELSSQK